MALRLSGRFMISQVMPSCFSIRTVSYFFIVTVFLLGWFSRSRVDRGVQVRASALAAERRART